MKEIKKIKKDEKNALKNISLDEPPKVPFDLRWSTLYDKKLFV